MGATLIILHLYVIYLRILTTGILVKHEDYNKGTIFTILVSI